MPAWRLLVSNPLPGAANMALDEALLRRARHTGETVLRVYAWSEPTLSLGRNQHARNVFNADRARALGVGIVRRPTGGRALVHHREVTYSVTSRVADGTTLRASYLAINRLLLCALETLGVPATLAEPTQRMAPPGSAPCFERPAAGEIVFEGRKLVGSAQLRDDGAMLQHGSILIDDDQPLIQHLADLPVGNVAAAATLREATGRAPSARVVADALFAAVRSTEDPDATVLTVDSFTIAAMGEAQEKFASDDWTWRR